MNVGLISVLINFCLFFPSLFATNFAGSCRPDDTIQVFGVACNLSLQSTVVRLKPWCWETSLTLSFSCLLLLGPFHWTMIFPMSSRNTSPRLKLFQLISTWKTIQNEAPDPHRVTRPEVKHSSHCAYLFGSHSFLSLNMEQSLHIIAVDFSVPHAGRDPAFLEAKDGGRVILWSL